MASLMDYFTPPSGKSLPYVLADYAIQGSDARTDTALNQSRSLRNHGWAQTDLVDSYSARGTARSGHAGLASDRVKQQYGDEYGDLQRQLDRQLASLSRAGVLATVGQVG